MHKPALANTAPARAASDDWRSRGACRDADPELFFPIMSAGPGIMQVARAKAVCARCGVQAECLQFAMESVQDHGVWGGQTEEERRALRRARIRQARHSIAVAEDRPQRRPRRPGRARPGRLSQRAKSLATWSRGSAGLRWPSRPVISSFAVRALATASSVPCTTAV